MLVKIISLSNEGGAASVEGGIHEFAHESTRNSRFQLRGSFEDFPVIWPSVESELRHDSYELVCFLTSKNSGAR